MCGIFFCIQIQGRESFNNDQLSDYFKKIQHRGPDCTTKLILAENDNKYSVFIGFHRLAITGLTDETNSMLSRDGIYLTCNGEIYNYKYLIKKYDLELQTKSDCEVILAFYRKFPDTFKQFINELDGDFAFVLYDSVKKQVHVARDRMGVRPLFQNFTSDCIMFASEAKALPQGPLISQFKPGLYQSLILDYAGNLGNFFDGKIMYTSNRDCGYHLDYDSAKNITRELLINAVKKRLDADRPIGFLLSGGLDSSLIVSIASKLIKKPLTTFSIGLAESSDLKAAKIVAEKLGTTHHEIIISITNVIDALPNVIYQNETADITTTRASIPMYLLGKYINERTDIKVVFSGEGADELFGGYLYFHNAPNLLAFQKETQRLLDDLYYFDVLRADRCISRWGLELRVPFLDADLLSFVSSLDPGFKIPDLNKNRIEKMLLREAFDGYLDKDILYRQKQAFSDGVGYTSVQGLKDYAKSVVNREEGDNVGTKTDEEILYHQIWNVVYGESAGLKTPYIWMPKWNDGVTDPSATMLEIHADNKNLDIK